jgi:hypothetical protein
MSWADVDCGNEPVARVAAKLRSCSIPDAIWLWIRDERGRQADNFGRSRLRMESVVNSGKTRSVYGSPAILYSRSEHDLVINTGQVAPPTPGRSAVWIGKNSPKAAEVTDQCTCEAREEGAKEVSQARRSKCVGCWPERTEGTERRCKAGALASVRSLCCSDDR